MVAIQSRISLSAKTSWQDVHLCLASGHVVVEVVAPGHLVVEVVAAPGQLLMESCSTYDILYTFGCSFMHFSSFLTIFIGFCDMVQLMKHCNTHQQYVAVGPVIAAAL